MIDYYKLEMKSEITSSNYPQTTPDITVQGLPVRFDLVKASDVQPEQFGTLGIVYADCYIPVPKNAGEINVHRNDKYGVSFDTDGYVTLGVKRENNG